MRDLRDPSELGHKLLESRAGYRRAGLPQGTPLHECADRWPLHVRNYDANPGPLEKYGDPTKIPSTMPCAVG